MVQKAIVGCGKSFYEDTLQTIAQNFFLQISTDSIFFSLFSRECNSTSHRNFGARSEILVIRDFSSRIIMNPCINIKLQVTVQIIGNQTYDTLVKKAKLRRLN